MDTHASILALLFYFFVLLTHWLPTKRHFFPHSLDLSRLLTNHFISRPIDDILYIEKGFIVGYNHRLGIGKALMAGYRGLSLDVCNCNGVLQFCHNICGESDVPFGCIYLCS